MAISLTCECGARLDIDDTFAGQTISCPDCARPLKAPDLRATGQRTSGLALTSFVLALIGAFTVVGTALAVVFGALALLQISRQRDRVTGSAYAVSGIVLGVLLTGFSVFAYSSVELFGIGRLMIEAQWSGKLDFPQSDEVVRNDFTIKRPSKAWGIFREAHSPTQPWQFDRHLEHLLLVNVAEDAHVICFVIRANPGEDWERVALEEFRDYNRVENYGRQSTKSRPARFESHDRKRHDAGEGVETVEMRVNRTHAGQARQFILRILKRRNDVNLYVVAAGARESNFTRVQPQLEQALESFRILDFGPRDWR